MLRVYSARILILESNKEKNNGMGKKGFCIHSEGSLSIPNKEYLPKIKEDFYINLLTLPDKHF